MEDLDIKTGKIISTNNEAAKVIDNFEKAKLAHDITALLIKYDAASFWAGKIPNQDYSSVLKTSFTASRKP